MITTAALPQHLPKGLPACLPRILLPLPPATTGQSMYLWPAEMNEWRTDDQSILLQRAPPPWSGPAVWGHAAPLRRREVRRSEPPNCLSHETLYMLPAHLLRGLVVQPLPPLLPPSPCHLPPSTLMLLLEAQCSMYLCALYCADILLSCKNYLDITILNENLLTVLRKKGNLDAKNLLTSLRTEKENL